MEEDSENKPLIKNTLSKPPQEHQSNKINFFKGRYSCLKKIRQKFFKENPDFYKIMKSQNETNTKVVRDEDLIKKFTEKEGFFPDSSSHKIKMKTTLQVPSNLPENYSISVKLCSIINEHSNEIYNKKELREIFSESKQLRYKFEENLTLNFEISINQNSNMIDTLVESWVTNEKINNIILLPLRNKKYMFYKKFEETNTEIEISYEIDLACQLDQIPVPSFKFCLDQINENLHDKYLFLVISTNRNIKDRDSFFEDENNKDFLPIYKTEERMVNLEQDKKLSFFNTILDFYSLCRYCEDAEILIELYFWKDKKKEETEADKKKKQEKDKDKKHKNKKDKGKEDKDEDKEENKDDAKENINIEDINIENKEEKEKENSDSDSIDTDDFYVLERKLKEAMIKEEEEYKNYKKIYKNFICSDKDFIKIAQAKFSINEAIRKKDKFLVFNEAYISKTYDSLHNDPNYETVLKYLNYEEDNIGNQPEATSLLHKLCASKVNFNATPMIPGQKVMFNKLCYDKYFQLNMNIAIDFTSSNKPVNNKRSLHYLYGEKPNPYKTILSAIGEMFIVKNDIDERKKEKVDINKNNQDNNLNSEIDKDNNNNNKDSSYRNPYSDSDSDSDSDYNNNSYAYSDDSDDSDFDYEARARKEIERKNKKALKNKKEQPELVKKESDKLQVKEVDELDNEIQKELNKPFKKLNLRLFGFGGIPKGKKNVMHCIHLNGKKNPIIQKVENISEAYFNTVKKITLKGPTLICPIVEKVINEFIIKKYEKDYEPKPEEEIIVEVDEDSDSDFEMVEKKKDTKCFKADEIHEEENSNNFFKIKNFEVILIVIDSEINDYDQFKQLIMKRINLPISIIIVGVGDSDFSKMKKFETNNEIGIYNKYNMPIERDFVHFIEYRELNNNPKMLANRILKDISNEINFFNFIPKYNNYMKNLETVYYEKRKAQLEKKRIQQEEEERLEKEEKEKEKEKENENEREKIEAKKVEDDDNSSDSYYQQQEFFMKQNEEKQQRDNSYDDSSDYDDYYNNYGNHEQPESIPQQEFQPQQPSNENHNDCDNFDPTSIPIPPAVRFEHPDDSSDSDRVNENNKSDLENSGLDYDNQARKNVYYDNSDNEAKNIDDHQNQDYNGEENFDDIEEH